MANPPSLHRPLPKDRQLAPAPIELPTEHSSLQMASPATSKRRKVAGKVVSLPRGSEQGDLSLESEEETGKYALYSIRPENDL